MILFTILLITLFLLILFGVLAISVGGAAAIIVFGDVIICGIFIVLLMKKIIKNKRK